MKYKSIGIIGVVILFVLSVIYVSYTQVSRSGKDAVHIDIFPTNAKITLDNRNINRGTIYLEPGSYSVKASHEGFEEHSDTIIVGPHLKTYVMTLSPITKEAHEMFDKQEREYKRVRKLSEQAAEESGEYFHKQNPIVSELPYRTFIYTIGYRLDKSDLTGNSIIIEIDAPEGYRQSALYRIRQLGYDPTDFNINFRDYKNPFPL